MRVNQNAVEAIRQALATHTTAMQLDIEEDDISEMQLWHMIWSIADFCEANKIDFDKILAEVRADRDWTLPKT